MSQFSHMVSALQPSLAHLHGQTVTVRAQIGSAGVSAVAMLGDIATRERPGADGRERHFERSINIPVSSLPDGFAFTDDSTVTIDGEAWDVANPVIVDGAYLATLMRVEVITAARNDHHLRRTG